MVFSASIIYACCITTIKISILLFYRRLFAVARFILTVNIVGAVAVAWWVVVMIIQIFSCIPVNGFWDLSVKAKCVNPAHFYIAVAVPNILTDFIILCMPLRMIWRLQTTPAQKVALSITFMTGAL